MTVNIRTWQEKGAWFASYCTGLESDVEQGTSCADALENLWAQAQTDRPADYKQVLSCIDRALDDAYAGDNEPCEHEDQS